MFRRDQASQAKKRDRCYQGTKRQNAYIPRFMFVVCVMAVIMIMFNAVVMADVVVSKAKQADEELANEQRSTDPRTN